MHEDSDLHGNVPDRSSVVLLLVDVINDLKFPGNNFLIQQATILGKNIARLKSRCGRAGIPTVYVNDNRGRWQSDFPAVVKRCIAPNAPGRRLGREVLPTQRDYVVLKPKHSAFYATPLDTLLTYMGVKSVILAGVTTNACILMTASDIYVRDLRLFVPLDCVAALTPEEHRTSLSIMRESFAADTTESKQLNLKKILRSRGK
jgi:nicotinamidase-related amidase